MNNRRFLPFTFLFLTLALAIQLGVVIAEANTSPAIISGTQSTGTWSPVTSPTYFTLLSVEMVSANDGWAIGTETFTGGDNIILNWDGTQWLNAGTIISPTVDNSTTVIYGDIAMLSPTDGWLVAGTFTFEQGIIMRWNGVAWTEFMTTANALVAIDMISASDGWAVASDGFGTIFYRWDGTAWQWAAGLFQIYAFSDIDMISNTDGWAIGLGGQIVRWNGNAWSAASSPVTMSLNSISMVSTTDGWIVGDGGVILRWSGNSWVQVASPVTTKLNSIKMISPTEGWAVGDNGVILHWDGNTWTDVTSPTVWELRSVTFISEFDGWAVGSGGTILHYAPAAATLTSNYTTGQSGSFFTFTGSNFPANGTATIIVNGVTLTNTLAIDNSGGFVLLLNTSQADAGYYSVTATTNPSATTSFTVDPNAPLRPQEGSGPILNVPGGIAFTQFIYLPLVQK